MQLVFIYFNYEKAIVDDDAYGTQIGLHWKLWYSPLYTGNLHEGMVLLSILSLSLLSFNDTFFGPFDSVLDCQHDIFLFYCTPFIWIGCIMNFRMMIFVLFRHLTD